MSSPLPPPLDRIVFISIPEQTARKLSDLPLDLSKLLPVEIPPGEDNWTIQNLSWEMIIAAMLKIFAWQPHYKDIEYYRSFINKVKPDLEYTLTKTGIDRVKNNDLAIAEEIFRALANYAPGQPNNFINLALVLEDQAELYGNLKNFDLSEKYIREAFHVYIDALKYHSSSPALLFNIGNFYIKQHNPEKARDMFEKFLLLEPEGNRKEFVRQIVAKIPRKSTEELYFLEAYDMIRMGNEDIGIEKIKLYLRDNPDIWNAWFLLGWGYRKKGEYALGKEALIKCITLKDTNIDAYNELSICLMECEEYNLCRTYLKKALQLDGENTQIISNLGVLAMKESNWQDADGFFRTVLDYDPQNKLAIEYLKYINKYL